MLTYTITITADNFAGIERAIAGIKNFPTAWRDQPVERTLADRHPGCFGGTDGYTLRAVVEGLQPPSEAPQNPNLTSCCQAFATYADDGARVCKKCFNLVSELEG